MTRHRKDDRGMTLTELLVGMVLGLLVTAMGYTILQTSTTTANAISARASNSTNARIALADLEANLRFADGVWLCSTTATSQAPCPTPTSTQTTMLTVSNATSSSNVTQPACAHWTITSAGLIETVSGASTTVMPGVVAYGTGAGFSLPLSNLVQLDFTVNGETVHVSAADAAVVHDLVAPDNLADAQSVTTACF